MAGDRLAAGGRDLFHYLLCRFGGGTAAVKLPPDICNDHPRTTRREEKRMTTPDPAPSAGDQHGFSVEPQFAH
jgi:hypothetical protein